MGLDFDLERSLGAILAPFMLHHPYRPAAFIHSTKFERAIRAVKEAARELEADESGEAFELAIDRLRKPVRTPN